MFERRVKMGCRIIMNECSFIKKALPLAEMSFNGLLV